MGREPRMFADNEKTNSVDGKVVWSRTKSLWYTSMLVSGIVLGPLTFSWQLSIASGFFTAFTLCFGHSVGLHRLLIHRSFQCPRWLEYCMVYAGVVVGMGGPKKVLYMHDIRDWSQRHPQCHPFYRHGTSIWRDWWWNLHCELRLDHPPRFEPERRVMESKFYDWLDRYWMVAQLPIAVVLYFVGGWPAIVWGICVRVALSLTGHWFVGHLAHHYGRQSWIVDGAAVQGYNVVGLGFITMGEAWHNNHHAFPESAKLGLARGQSDAGWWLLCALAKLNLVWGVQTPDELPHRPELHAADSSIR